MSDFDKFPEQQEPAREEEAAFSDIAAFIAETPARRASFPDDRVDVGTLAEFSDFSTEEN